MPNVLKVFLENGQTKSFKYDNKTTVKVSRLIASQVFFSFVCIRRVRLNLDPRFLYMKSAHSAFRVGRYGCLCTLHWVLMFIWRCLLCTEVLRSCSPLAFHFEGIISIGLNIYTSSSVALHVHHRTHVFVCAGVRTVYALCSCFFCMYAYGCPYGRLLANPSCFSSHTTHINFPLSPVSPSRSLEPALTVFLGEIISSNTWQSHEVRTAGRERKSKREKKEARVVRLELDSRKGTNRIVHKHALSTRVPPPSYRLSTRSYGLIVDLFAPRRRSLPSPESP